MLKENETITKLNMNEFDMSETIEDWRTYLMQTNTLKNLKLGSMNIDPKSAKILFEGLKQNNSITTLELFSANIGGDQLLNLSDIVLSKAHFKRLYLPYIHYENQQGIDAICSLLKANRLDRLAITGCFFQEDEDARNQVLDALQYDHTLKFLSANAIFLRDEHCTKLSAWLKKSRAIQTLRISCNLITDEGCKTIGEAIKYHAALERLALNHNPLNENAVEWICQGLKLNSTLTEVTLDGCKVTANVINSICDMLKVNDSLARLYFYDYPRFVDTTALELLAQAITANDSLETLHFFHTISHDANYVKLARKLQQNSTAKEILQCDWWILSNNIARQKECFELFPSEIWLAIFNQIRHCGVAFAKIAYKAFCKYNRV